MQEIVIEKNTIDKFKQALIEQEHGSATVEKYNRDIYTFYHWLPENKAVNKRHVIAYKEYLSQNYAISSANSMLTALNRFFVFIERKDFTVKNFRKQRQTFYPEERELSRPEFMRLISAAKNAKDYRTYMIMQAICSTGIRISELPFITVEALKCGRADVHCKGKIRTILIPSSLCKELQQYSKRQSIKKGSVFVTNTGRPIDRSNIWRMMKRLCGKAGVMLTKVFPHNLRHLFARTFYKQEKDIVSLADILGHSSVDTTRVYIISTGEEHLQKINALRLNLFQY